MRRLVPAGVFVLLVVSVLGDQYFRDEFYYLACARRPDWGYVDHPPLSIAILLLITRTIGESLLALRLATAVVYALNVAVTASIARRLGGSVFAQTIAMLCAATAPGLLSSGTFYSMNVFDLLIWTLAFRVLIDVLDQPALSRWALMGVLLGLGLQNKIGVLWLGAGIAAGLALTPARRLLLTPGPYLAGAIAALVFAPHVVWQVFHGWPTLEFIRNASRDKMQVTPPLEFVLTQVMNMNPLFLPVWLGGLTFLFSRGAVKHRPLAVAYVTVATILILNKTSRAGYLGPAYPMLFAAGGVWLETVLSRPALRAVAVSVLLIAGAVTAPLAVPLLSVDRYVAYSRALGVAPSTEEKKDLGRLPQFFADRQGWDRFVDQVAAAADRLSPAERASAAIFVGNYGEAGAIEHLGRSRGLTAISGHNNYWWWGPAGRTGGVLIVVSRSRERQEQCFASVELAGTVDCGDCMPYENGLSIFICRGMKPPPLPERWASFKHYD